MSPSVPTAPIALSCGEPAGVGPEIAVKAAQALDGAVPFFWIGDPRHLPHGARFSEISDPSEAHHVASGTLAVLRHEFHAMATPGVPDYDNAQGVIDVLRHAVALVQTGQASALCTAPIHKKVLKDGAGFAYPGHTEFLAHLAGVERVVMMLACPELRVVPVTIHIALRDVPEAFTSELLEETIRITATDLEKFWGICAPRIAIAGLNPHAGEGGAMGDEELEWMIPLISRLKSEGFDLKGPMPPDTMFHARARAGYDVALCAYHDQALIPIKTIDFAGGVNVTLGLPFIRTSPDHGTAFDIAGQNKADPTSLIAALNMAHEMSHAKRQKDHG
ncbi:4-hydroxythreonine-4-phosphate dehydrogenase PdxA [Celeribacter baekdonensis]|uniref:4-hydroxythreonine-4-phosphate dehydrogenase n=1 Tax=Celeribacter baekdonensis TaxID=875171 RepID=A0A2R4M226_9RHOB|nr:4-hydroxythreonine-4-phosphate dehydrogenase PdxA [Celeribacter baekdonensis]AVW91159.1 4-hydroxythreonine-4-phosphate dehydrogenase PdxA [Celeribacter baekdonensis]